MHVLDAVQYLNELRVKGLIHVKEKKYDMGGSSTGEPVYQCGTHNFETKNLNEFK